MNLRELLKKSRSCRRFKGSEPVALDDLKSAVENVRFAPSPANLQPLKFIICIKDNINKKIFSNTKWAVYLKDWDGPEEGERPGAYILILGTRNMSAHIHWDYGIALQTILLSLAEKGYGACTVAAIDRDAIREILSIPKKYDLPALIAVGRPDEEIVIDDIKDDRFKYWRDDKDVHHVPKRAFKDLVYKIIS